MNSTLAIFGWLGPWEIILILIVALLLFGRRLPEVARSMGQAVVQFKSGLNEVESTVNNAGTKPQIEKPKDTTSTTASTATTPEATQQNSTTQS